MTQLVWDQAGDRFYETGVDRGVLFVANQPGVAWNGLISVTESPSGAEVSSQYAGNIKYVNLTSVEEFGGTIEAFTYPEEFEICDGTANIHGIAINQQPRMPFAFSYRTLKGNDTAGISYGYKIHIVFEALAAPTEVQYSSTDDQPEALTFSWEFSASTVNVGSLKFSKVSFDTTRVDPAIIQLLEGYLYGTKTTAPQLPSLEWLASVFENPPTMFNVEPTTTAGFSPLLKSGDGDFIGSPNVGVYTASKKSDLVETADPGIYILEQ